MPILKFTKADLLKGQTIKPDWYKCEVMGIVLKTPKTGSGDSINYVVTIKLPGLDGQEMDHTFNSKAMGLMAPFIAACLGKKLKEITDALDQGVLDFDTDLQTGKKLQVKIKNEPWEGRMTNKAEDWLPEDAKVPF